jgi:hypothetical protein
LSQGSDTSADVNGNASNFSSNQLAFARPSKQYREFAEECRRFAQLAKTDEQRKILHEMEVVWTKLAEEAEGRTANKAS